MVHSQPTWLYAPKYTLKREVTSNLTWLYAPMYTPAYSIQRLVEGKTPGTGRRQLQVPGTGRCEAGGVWWVVIGGCHVACSVADWGQHMVAEMMTLVNLIVGTVSLAQPRWQDLTMPHGHRVDHSTLRICRKGKQFDHEESRSPTQIFKRNIVPACHRLWAYVRAISLGLIEMMAMAMAMVLVIVIVMIVPEVDRQVG